MPTLVATIAAPTKMASMGRPPKKHNRPTHQEGKNDTESRNEKGGSSDPHEFVSLDVEPDPKQEKEDSEVAKRRKDLVGLDPSERARAYQHSGEDLADNAGLTEILKQLRKQFSRAENGEHRQRNVRHIRSVPKIQCWCE